MDAAWCTFVCKQKKSSNQTVWQDLLVVLLGFNGFYWVLLGFTGFYWVLLGFTGFYWVLLGVDAGISVVSNVFFVAGTATSSHSALLATGSGVTSEFSFRPIIRILPSSFFFIHCLLFFCFRSATSLRNWRGKGPLQIDGAIVHRKKGSDS